MVDERCRRPAAPVVPFLAGRGHHGDDFPLAECAGEHQRIAVADEIAELLQPVAQGADLRIGVVPKVLQAREFFDVLRVALVVQQLIEGRGEVIRQLLRTGRDQRFDDSAMLVESAAILLELVVLQNLFQSAAHQFKHRALEVRDRRLVGKRRQLDHLARIAFPESARHLEITLDRQIGKHRPLLRIDEHAAEDREVFDQLARLAVPLVAEQNLRKAGILDATRLLVGRRIIGILQRRREDALAFLVKLLGVILRVDLRP